MANEIEHPQRWHVHVLTESNHWEKLLLEAPSADAAEQHVWDMGMTTVGETSAAPLVDAEQAYAEADAVMNAARSNPTAGRVAAARVTLDDLEATHRTNNAARDTWRGELDDLESRLEPVNDESFYADMDDYHAAEKAGLFDEDEPVDVAAPQTAPEREQVVDDRGYEAWKKEAHDAWMARAQRSAERFAGDREGEDRERFVQGFVGDQAEYARDFPHHVEMAYEYEDADAARRDINAQWLKILAEDEAAQAREKTTEEIVASAREALAGRDDSGWRQEQGRTADRSDGFERGM